MIDCHPIPAEFRNEQLYIHNIDEGENVIFQPLDSFSFEAVKSFQSRSM